MLFVLYRIVSHLSVCRSLLLNGIKMADLFIGFFFTSWLHRQ